MPILKAGVLTVAIVVGSAFIYSPGIGYGGWLLGTIPLSPFIFGFVLLIFRLKAGQDERLQPGHPGDTPGEKPPLTRH